MAATAIALAGAALVVLPAALPHLGQLASPKGALAAAYLGVLVTAFGYRLFVMGLKRISPQRALSLQLVQPVPPSSSPP